MHEKDCCVCKAEPILDEPKLVEKIRIIKEIQMKNCSMSDEIRTILFAVPDAPNVGIEAKCLNDEINEIMELSKLQAEILYQIRERI